MRVGSIGAMTRRPSLFVLVMVLRGKVAGGVELLSEVDCDADGV